MNVFNVATLDIPVAMLRLLKQAFSHVSQFNILVYFLHSSYTFPLVSTNRVTYFESCLNDTRPEGP